MNTVCKEHEWVERKYVGGVDVAYADKSYIEGYRFICSTCGKVKPPTDFKISENLEQVNTREWEDIEKDFYRFTNEFGLNQDFKTFFDWMKGCFLAPEKK